MSSQGITETAQFIGSPGEELYSMQFYPSAEVTAHIIYVAPFGEEMNRSRALVAQQARAFANKGYSCTLVDLYGTGDSQGRLEDASMETWLQNIVDTAEFLQQKTNAPCILWGVRLGGLMAVELAHRFPDRFNKLVLWQPVVSGKKYMTQLLRLRIASLVGKAQAPETTSGIRERLNAGEIMDVAGYPLSGQLLNDIEGRSIASFSQINRAHVHWFEYVGEPPQTIATSVQKGVDALRSLGAEVNLLEFSSAPVWQLQKRQHSDNLIELTVGLSL